MNAAESAEPNELTPEDQSGSAQGGGAQSPQSDPSPTAPDQGKREPDCPACGWGYMYPIAATEDGTVFFCFHCQRGYSVPDEGNVGEPAVAGVDGPTGAQMTHQQLADMQEANPDHPAVKLHGKVGSGGAS